MEGKRKVIGFMLEELESKFATELVHDVVNSIPKDENIELVVTAGKYINQAVHEKTRPYKLVYNSIYKLSNVCHLDGLLIHLGSIEGAELERLKKEYYAGIDDIPKVFITFTSSEQTTVNYDNESGIREAVNCLVNVNGLTRFCMLGGRDDNADARERRDIFIKCLKENGIELSRWNYEKTDMSELTVTEAERLLDNNPGVQAIFCVNDAVAKGLYTAMRKRSLVPGEDIMVFGFDNTHMAGEMIPTLSSIGTDNCSLGQRALEVLLAKMNGTEIKSALVPTRLYGRESLCYEMYDYTMIEMQLAQKAFIYRVFDDCFYRYRSETIDRAAVDLKRLFLEFMTRILNAEKYCYMSFEEFDDFSSLISIFFEKGAMTYTDATKLISGIERLQAAMNTISRSSAVMVMVNRLCTQMRSEALCAIAEEKSRVADRSVSNRRNIQEFMIASMLADEAGAGKEEKLMRTIDRLGIDNAALYLYDEPVVFDNNTSLQLPEYIRLKCIMRAGELYVIPEERQRGPMSKIFLRDELPAKCRGFAALNIFYGNKIYGILMCEITDEIYNRGDYIALQLGRAIHTARSE